MEEDLVFGYVKELVEWLIVARQRCQMSFPPSARLGLDAIEIFFLR